MHPVRLLMALVLIWLTLTGCDWAGGQSAGIAGSIPVSRHLQRLEQPGGLTGLADPSQRLTLAQVKREANRYALRPVGSPVSISGPTAYFLCLPLVNHDTGPLPVLLEIDHPFLERLEACLVVDGRNATVFPPQSQRTPQAGRVYAHRNFVLPLTLPSRRSATVWLRLVKSPGSHAFPLRLWQPADFVVHTVAEASLWGTLLGWLLFAAVLSGLLAMVTGESVYWLYGFYVLAHLLTISVHEGILSDGYTAGLPGLAADYVGDVALGLLTGSNLLFVRALLASRRYIPEWLSTFSQVWLIVWCIWLLGYVVDSLGQPTHATTPLGQVLYGAKLGVHQIGAVIVILLIRYGLRAKAYRRLAQTYLVAFVPLFIVAMLDFYANLRPVPLAPFVQVPTYAGGIVLETLVLTYGLVFRFRTYRHEHERLVNEQNQLALRTQLAERERLGRDLHDHIGPDLVALKLQLEAAREDIADATIDRLLNRVIGQADRIVADVRQVSHALMPIALQHAGLTGALQAFVRQLNLLVEGPELSFTHTLTDGLAEWQQQGLLQIAKELINNAVRHAGATLIDVELYQIDRNIHLTVSDNGRGYEPVDVAKHPTGIGLRNVRTVIRQLKGRMEVARKPTGGMKHEVVVPASL